MIAVTVSDSAATAGMTVSIAIEAQQPPIAHAIAAFRVRLAVPSRGLQYLGEVATDPGIRAVNVTGDTVRIAGAAPGAGFTDGQLITLRFRVVDPVALRSMTVLVDELRDTTFADRRVDFATYDQGVHVSITQGTAPHVAFDGLPPIGVQRVYGDATGDGTIDASDALAILTIDVGLTPPFGFDNVAADANVDGQVNALDAQIVLASLVGRDVGQFRMGDVVGSPRVTLTAITPDTLRPGVTATITGTNFGTTTVGDTVMIDTIAAAVTAATSTQLTVTVPAAMPCRATHPAAVTVRVSGATGHGRQMFVVAPQRTMHVGDVLLFDTDSAFRCNEFTSGRYFIAVYNAARVASFVPTPFQLVSTTAFGLDSTIVADRTVPPMAPRTVSPPLRRPITPPLPWAASSQVAICAPAPSPERERMRNL